MKLHEMNLRNFGTFAKYCLRFEPGLTGFIGKIGSGKSTLLESATYFAMTGNAASGLDRKDQLVNWDADKGSTAISFEHQGAEYVLARQLIGSTCSLDVHYADGTDARITGANNVAAEMKKITGMLPEVLYETCYVRQGHLWQIVEMTHAQRMEYFQRVANTLEAERLKQVFVKQQSMIQLFPDRLAQINELTGEIERTEVMRSASAADEARHSSQLTELLKDWDGKQRLSQRIPEADRDAQMEALQPVLNKHLDDQARLAAARAAVKQPTPIPAEMHQANAEYQHWAQSVGPVNAAIAELQQVLAAIADAEKVSAEMLPKKAALLDEQSAVNSELAVQLSQQREVRNLLELVKKGTCPTCKRPMDAADGIELSNTLATLEAAHATLQMRKKQVDNDVTQTQQWERQQIDYLAGLQRRRSRCESIRDNAPVQPFGFKPEAYQAAVAVYEKESAEFKQAERITAQMATVQQEIGRVRQKLEHLRELPVLTQEEAFALDKYFQEVQDTQNALNAAQMAKLRWETSLEQLGRQLQGLQKEQNDGELARERSRVLARCSELLHRDQLPRIVMASFRLELNNELQTILGRFNAEFTADLTEDFDVVVHFGRHRNKPAGPSTSGGQKTLLSIAFHMAMTKLLAGSIPLMVLDEPTNHLGEADRLQVRNVLLNLKRTIGQTTCLLVSTHDPLLHPAFDRIVDISER